MIDLSSLQAVFFDADDTLYRINGTVGSRYAVHFQSHGHDIPVEDIDRVIPIAWNRLVHTYENQEGAHRSTHERDKSVWVEYVRYVMEELTLGEASESLFHAIYTDFGRGESRELHPHIKPLLEQLSTHNMLLGVLTNNDKRIHQIVPELGLEDHFDHIFCASDIGYKKPSPLVFKGVADRIGISPEQILYIGDCPKNDIEGAKAAGWQALWYKRPDMTHPNNVTDTKEIPCFSKLIDFLAIPQR